MTTVWVSFFPIHGSFNAKEVLVDLFQLRQGMKSSSATVIDLFSMSSINGGSLVVPNRLLSYIEKIWVDYLPD